MTNEQINRMAAEALGLEWLEPKRYLVVYNPNFCDDLNAAQRLVKHTINATDYSYYGETLIDVAWEREADTSAWLIEETLQLPAKTITLACLVALGKITLEEAKESL